MGFPEEFAVSEPPMRIERPARNQDDDIGVQLHDAVELLARRLDRRASCSTALNIRSPHAGEWRTAHSPEREELEALPAREFFKFERPDADMRVTPHDHPRTAGRI